MALGYCKECHKLVSIEAREFVGPGRRERRWYPVAHDKPDGAPCLKGPKKGI
jgi:hypothetical protein